MRFPGFILVLIISLTLFAVGCGVDSTPAPTSAPPTAAVVSTLEPAPTDPPAPTSAAQPTTGAAATAPATAAAPAEPGALAQTVADAEGNVYAFQVIPEETTVEYAVDEVLFGNKQITRGRTNAVEGNFKLGMRDGKPYFDLSTLRVDLRTLESDNRIRDGAIRRQWLESDRYPYADFVAKEILEFPAEASAGQEYKFKVSGDMTIREITKPITFDVTVKLEGEMLTGTGVTQIFMKDFGFDPPEILGRFTVSDPATITITGVARYVPESS